MTGSGARWWRPIGLALMLSSFFWLGPASASAEHGSRTPATVSTHKGVAARTRGCVHVVRRGDTVTRIAARYHVPRRSIVTANHLGDGEAVRAGQRLRIAECKMAPGRRPVDRASTAVISRDGPALVARVGPRRIPTSLYLAVPDLDGGPIFHWPIEGPILSPFGRRTGGWHAGVDIKGEAGAPVRASAPGVVIVSTWEATYGYVVKIEHYGGYTTLYAHNMKNLVEVGDEVRAGTVIATVGRSGRASAFHVHFEVRKGGMAYNPLYVLETSDSPVLVSAPDTPAHDDAP